MKSQTRLALSGSTAKANLRDVGPALLEQGPRAIPVKANAKKSPSAEAGAMNTLKTLHLRLRGRYPLVVVLGLVFGGVCAVASQRLYHPLYRSGGLVRIAYSKPVVIKETDQNRPLANYQTWMQSQKTVISSRRIIDMAIQDPIWRATNHQVPQDSDRYFAQHLLVDIKPNSELIDISMTDADPGTAATAVTAVINSYAEYYNNQEKEADRQLIGVLTEREGTLEAKITQLTGQIQTASQEYGSANLDIFYDAAAARVNRMKSSLEEIRTAIAFAPAPTASAGKSDAQPISQPSAVPTPSRSALSLEQIAASDPVMLNYFNELSRCEQDMARLREQGLGSNHKEVVIAQRMLDAARTRVDKYAAMFREYHTATAQNLAGSGSVGTEGKSVETLRANEANLLKLLAESKLEMVTVGNKQIDLQHWQADLATARIELADLKNRIEVFHAEDSLGSRLTVVSTGEAALSPEKDPRMQLAAAAGVGGACVPAGAMLVLSCLKRRYRYADDTESDATSVTSKIPLLGILPELPAEGEHDERLESAAHSIHEIRVSLRAQGSPATTYLVTSATPGEGKTSLTLSLGLSFAASRLRTLVIDGDLVGRNLTRTLNAKEIEGFHEATHAGSLRRLVRKTDTGLYLLTSGKPAAGKPCSVSAEGVKTLLIEARQYFDVVLIDTGPILGSLESQVLAQEVDGVIFVISRGQERHLVERAMDRLTSLGASIVGCVFNRAKLSDFDRSSSFGSSTRSLSPALPGADAPKADKQVFARFGPLVKAVAYGIPAASN